MTQERARYSTKRGANLKKPLVPIFSRLIVALPSISIQSAELTSSKIGYTHEGAEVQRGTAYFEG